MGHECRVSGIAPPNQPQPLSRHDNEQVDLAGIGYRQNGSSTGGRGTRLCAAVQPRHGGVAERSNAAALKAVDRVLPVRGFESLPLRLRLSLDVCR
jgi:hypothetical protein